MNFFTFDIRKVFAGVLLVVLPLLAINMQKNSEEELWFTKPFSWSAGLIQNGFHGFSSGVRGTTSMYLNLIDVKVRNKQLEEDLARLRAELGSVTELKLENQRLNELLGFKQASAHKLIAAKIVGRDLLPDHHTLTIDRGTEDGIKKNMAVITTGGVVGYIFRTESQSSQILLLTDRYAAIDSIIQRSRARGVIEGHTRELARLSHLKRSDDVKEGDLVVTSGLFRIFPKGFTLGTVTSVERSQYGLSQKVEVAPAVDLSNLEEVFVITETHDPPTPEEAPIPDAPSQKEPKKASTQ